MENEQLKFEKEEERMKPRYLMVYSNRIDDRCIDVYDVTPLNPIAIEAVCDLVYLGYRNFLVHVVDRVMSYTNDVKLLNEYGKRIKLDNNHPYSLCDDYELDEDQMR